MEIERKYAILIENFEENYIFNERSEKNASFRVLKLNYLIKNNNFNVEVKSKVRNNPFFFHNFAALRFYKFFSGLKIPFNLSFFLKKIVFFDKKFEKKWDFSQTTVLEFFQDEKISFYFSFPETSDLKRVRNLLNYFLEEKLKILSDIPKNLPLIFGEGTGGVLFHEIVSHPLEADIFKISYYKDKIGEKVTKDFITIYDDPTARGFPVKRRFDDEGENCSKRILIEKGILKNILCTNFYSKTFLFPPGNGRFCMENPFPLPRATNIILEPVIKNNSPLYEIYPNFLFIPFIKKASFLPPDRVEIVAGPVFYYLNKKIYGKIKYLKISGNISDFLKGIDFVSCRARRCLTFGICSKDGGKLFAGALSPDISFINLSYKI